VETKSNARSVALLLAAAVIATALLAVIFHW